MIEFGLRSGCFARDRREWESNSQPVHTTLRTRCSLKRLQNLGWHIAHRQRLLSRKRKIWLYTIGRATVCKERFGMIQLTETAVTKVSGILKRQEPKPAGLRIAEGGGGGSGVNSSSDFE